MFDVLPIEAFSGFRVRRPEDTVGFHVSGGGSAQAAPPNPASFRGYGNAAPSTDAPHGNVYSATDDAYDLLKGNPYFDLVRGPSNGAEVANVNATGDQPGFSGRLRSILDDVGNAAEQVGRHANAFVNGAYSVFPGTYGAVRALGRGVGLLGPEEFRRFGQEADFVGNSLGQIVRYPEPAIREGAKTLSTLYSDPLFRSYSTGRALMGYLTRLGGAATAGDALRALENGHNLVDSLIYGGLGPYGRLGLPPTHQ